MLTAAIGTEETADRVVQAPRVVLAAPAAMFADRALRFRQLAREHPMGPFLDLMAAVSEAQSAVAAQHCDAALSAHALAASREHGMPPLDAGAHARDARWIDDLHAIVDALPPGSLPSPLRAALRAGDGSALDALADRLLSGASTDDEAAAVPFVGAALQVYFARLAATLTAADVDRCDVPTLCPVCASRPVASVVRIGAERAGLRYLVCGLCGTEWNLARIKCSFCEEDRSLQYFAAEGDGRRGNPAWRAEACDECRTYLKIFYQEKDPQLEPLADDLASLALDVLLDERGFARSGPLIVFHPGAG